MSPMFKRSQASRIEAMYAGFKICEGFDNIDSRKFIFE